MREASDFLSYSFHGGTDLQPVLLKSVNLMTSGKYQNADLVMISDFIAPEQNEETVKKVGQLKRHKNRFHAINLSKYGNPSLLGLFDHQWSYHPSIVGRIIKRS